MQHILLIGAGMMGMMHTYSYLSVPNAKLVGIVDPAIEQAEKLAQVSGARAFPTLEEAMAQLERVDVIDVCVATPLHKEYVFRAADLGKHVICEKPIARTPEDARAMIEYCDAKQVKLFVAHVVRFFPEYAKAKELVDQGSIGTPGVARMSRVSKLPDVSGLWYADYSQSGGPVLDMAIHDIDYLRWCFGEVERVYAKSLIGRSKVKTHDYALVTLRFRSGVIAHVEGSWAHESFATRFEIAGSGGIIDFDSVKDKSMSLTLRNPQSQAGGVYVPESPLAQSPYTRELQHFLTCLETDTEPLVSAEDAYKAVEISVAALRSMETGQPVELA